VKSFADGKIDVYLGPVELCAADNLKKAIVDFIGGARGLDIALLEIDPVPIAEAIINARWNGVSINVFVEQDYIRATLETSTTSSSSRCTRLPGVRERVSEALAGTARPRPVGRRAEGDRRQRRSGQYRLRPRPRVDETGADGARRRAACRTGGRPDRRGGLTPGQSDELLIEHLFIGALSCIHASLFSFLLASSAGRLVRTFVAFVRICVAGDQIVQSGPRVAGQRPHAARGLAIVGYGSRPGFVAVTLLRGVVAVRLAAPPSARAGTARTERESGLLTLPI
jgi:hypothetical protein